MEEGGWEAVSKILSRQGCRLQDADILMGAKAEVWMFWRNKLRTLQERASGCSKISIFLCPLIALSKHY